MFDCMKAKALEYFVKWTCKSSAAEVHVSCYCNTNIGCNIKRVKKHNIFVWKWTISEVIPKSMRNFWKLFMLDGREWKLSRNI